MPYNRHRYSGLQRTHNGHDQAMSRVVRLREMIEYLRRDPTTPLYVLNRQLLERDPGYVSRLMNWKDDLMPWLAKS